MSGDMDMETFVQNRLTENEKDASATVELDPQFKVCAGDIHKKTAGFLMDSMLENVDKWKHRLEIYMEDEEDDLSPDEWKELEGSLTKFHNDVLKRFGDNSEGGLHSVPSESYALEAIEAIKLVKTIKWRVSDTFDEIYFDDMETEVERLLNKVVDKAVLIVDGGRPFERTEIDWVDPAADPDFNKELYDFASANQSLPDAQAIPWLPPASQEAPKLLPRDILKRLTTPLKIDDVDDHEDWEYSATHPPDEEDSYAQFEGPFEQLRKNLKDLLTAEIPNYSKNLDTTSIDPMVVEVASQRLKAGETDLDFKSMFILPYDTNSCKLVGIRDDTIGNLKTYKEVLKPPSERIMDRKLRNDPSSWLDPERPAGPRIRTFGWEPLANINADLPTSEKEVMKKKENPDALKTGSEMSPEARERSEQLVQMLKEKCAKVIEEKKFTGDVGGNPSIKDYLKRKGQSFGIIPEHFDTPEDFLDSLDMPNLREKDASKAFPLENEVIPLEPDWLGLDGSGPHVQLTEELYWTQLQSFKKPLSVPTVDWMALLDQDIIEDEDGTDSAELRRYLREATEPLKKDLEVVEPPEVQDVTKIEKDTPAKKRALDKEFVQEWIGKFGNDDGMQGLDPKNFKPPEHLVSSEEYQEKFLTHPYTSSYVFHPNFARFRRMTRNHPTYSEYTFKKLESGSTLASEDNLREFKAILSDLDKNGPQVATDDIKPLNEKNLGVDAAEARKWEMEFSKYMAEGLSLLDSYAEKSRSAFKNPEKHGKEETSEDLLFRKLEKLELPELSKEFHLQPFTLEDFDNLPEVGATNDVDCKEKPEKPVSSTLDDSDSDSDESDDEVELTRSNVSWRPFKEFNDYKNVNVPQLLFGAAQLIETSTPKHFHPPPKVLEWIEGKYQPSTTKLKKWRKLYGSLFPRVDSPLTTPYLFLSEEEKQQRLRKPNTENLQSDPWALTEEERLALKNPPKKADEGDQADDAAGDDNISRMEQKSGIVLQLNRNTQQWAEELNINEAPDMSVLGTPAMEFMFQLDNFQKQAIMALEKGYNVFVSAHTSAGKTVVAEYAIAMSRKRRSRAIYTSPIKALSNQKYKDFKKCFESVGLITGDVQLNERADCLIMTTEILRSMLYNASEGIRDLEFVVLDEVHYMNDPERGHVWEEVLILLPANVQIVMLSATVPNAMEFASWVGRNKERKVKVCKTLHRPVPLKHYFNVFIDGQPSSAGQFLLRDGDHRVNIDVWEAIKNTIDAVNTAERQDLKSSLKHKRAKKGEQDQSDPYGPGCNKQNTINFYRKKEKLRWIKLIEYLKEIEWLPTIVFAFSRKKCDELANLLKQTDLTTPEEKLCIRLFIKSQVAKLDEEDRNLPQVQVVRSHLVRGIGVHHSGILPVLKEIVEILFQEGKVKLLFATETFAMGVNMPARTVVFYSIIKFDGDERRVLRPAEYTQMAGRAGRRGEDTVGNVIIAYNSKDREKITLQTVTAMMTGSPQTLKSQFRVSYRMILGTLTARSHITAENMMKQSYHENNEQNNYFKLEEALRKVKEKESQQKTVICSRYPKDYVDKLCEIYDLIDNYLNMWNKLRRAESTTPKFLREVQVGKLVKFRHGCISGDVGVIMKVTTSNDGPMEFVVLGLRDFDRNADLERHPDVFITDRWYQFLSLFPHPKKNHLTGEVDKRFLTYTIKVEDILEIYKDSANIKEEEAPLLIRNANLSNFGGRSYGFSNETRTVFGDSIGHPKNPYCMPYPTSQNMPHLRIQSTNIVSSECNSPRTPGRTQIYKGFPDSGQNLNSASPGNVCRAPDSSKSCAEDRVFKQQNTKELWKPSGCSSPSYDCDTPSFIRYNSEAAVHLKGNEYVQRSVSYVPQHPLIGQPFKYLTAAPPHFPGFSYNQTNRPDFNAPNRFCVPYRTPNLPVCTVQNMNSTPYVQGVNICSPNQATPVRSWTPFQQNHFPTKPPIQLTNLQYPRSNPSLAVCRPPALENEVEFPKLGSSPLSDKSAPVPHKMCSSADSVVSTPLTQEGNFVLDNTRCNVSLNVPTYSSLSQGVPYSTPNQPVCMVQNINSTSYVQGVNICSPNQATPVRSWTPFQQNHFPTKPPIQLTNLQHPLSNPSLAVCRPPALENEVEFPKLGSSPLSNKSAPVSHKMCSSADSVVSTSLTPEGNQYVKRDPGNVIGSCTERFGNRESTRTSLQGYSCPESVLSGFPLKLDPSTNRVMQGWDVRASRSPPSGRPNPVQFVVPHPVVSSHHNSLFHPQLATPLGYSVTHGGLGRPHPNPQYHSQVSRNPCDFSPSYPPPSCYPNFTIPPTFPRPSCPPNQLSHPQIPLNCALVYGPRNTTKSDNDLERICYQLYSRIGFKPVDEAALATDFELYQIMKIVELEFRSSIDEFYKEQSREYLVGAFADIFQWKELVEKKDRMEKDLADQTMTLYPEYASKMSILKTMNYIVGDSVQMKGYMAARISKYEIVVTEMLVKNVIEDLTPEEVAGLMSFIVYQSKAKPSQVDDDDNMPVPTPAAGRPNLQKAIENTKAIIDEIKNEEQLVLKEFSEDWDNLKGSFELTDIMYQWANQKSFGWVIKMAQDFQEGMLVRWIQQLVEALNEIASAARVMGDPAVPEKIQASIKSIKRGIVFSPSLYTTL